MTHVASDALLEEVDVMKLRIVVSVFIAAVMLLSQDAVAQAYPSRPIRMIVGFPAGGSVDAVARLISLRLGESLRQQVIVDNRPGAHGIIGADLVAKASPDGYTLLMASGGHSINPALYKKLPYDTLLDFAPITRVASYPLIVLTHPSLPVKSIRDLVQLAKSKPGQLNYASTGSGSTAHLATEMFMQTVSIKMQHIPYKGGAPALTDLIAGQTQVMFNVILVGLPHVKSGKLRGLAVTSAERAGAAPDIPTIEEAGYKGFEIDSWTGVVGPAGMPRVILDRLHSEIVNVTKLNNVASRLRSEGANVVANSPSQFAVQIKNEIEKWRQIVKIAGVSLDY